MSNFEYRLNRRFWRSKKVVQVVQFWGGEGGGIKVIWTKFKRTATFFSGHRPLHGMIITCHREIAQIVNSIWLR